MENSTATQPTTAWPPRRVALATLVALAIACAFWILFRFRLVFFSLFIAIVLATAIQPLIDRLARFKIPRAVSMILILLIVLVLIVVGVLAVAPMVSSQWAAITTLLSNTYQSLRASLAASENLLLQRIASYLPLTAQPAGGAAGETSSNMAQQAVSIGSIVFRDLILGIYVLILTALWVLEGEVATRVLLMALPAARRDPAREFLGDIENKIGAYTRGLALDTLIMGALAAVGYGIIGLPNILFLGVFAGLMELVPLIGPLLGAIPAFLIAASIGPSKVILTIIVYIFIHLIEGNFIVPRVMDKTVGVNPVASLLAFIAFGSIFGFLGALLAVPLAAVIQLILNRLVFNASAPDQVPPTGRNTISTLRYEAQDLVQDVRKQVREKDADVNAHEDRIEDSMEAIAVDLDSILAQAETDDSSGKLNAGGNGRQK